MRYLASGPADLCLPPASSADRARNGAYLFTVLGELADLMRRKALALEGFGILEGRRSIRLDLAFLVHQELDLVVGQDTALAWRLGSFGAWRRCLLFTGFLAHQHLALRSAQGRLRGLLERHAFLAWRRGSLRRHLRRLRLHRSLDLLRAFRFEQCLHAGVLPEDGLVNDHAEHVSPQLAAEAVPSLVRWVLQEAPQSRTGGGIREGGVPSHPSTLEG